MTPGDYAAWRARFARAVEGNRREDARAPIVALTSPAGAASGACSVLQRHGVRYWFRRDGNVATWGEVKRRGYAACSEAAALATALALNRGAREVVLCVEEHPSDPAYSHVAAYVSGVRVDCFADRSLAVDSCRYRWAFGPGGWDGL